MQWRVRDGGQLGWGRRQEHDPRPECLLCHALRQSRGPRQQPGAPPLVQVGQGRRVEVHAHQQGRGQGRREEGARVFGTGSEHVREKDGDGNFFTRYDYEGKESHL